MRIYEQLSIKVLKDPSFNTTLAGPLRCVGHRLGAPGTFQPGRMAMLRDLQRSAATLWLCQHSY